MTVLPQLADRKHGEVWAGLLLQELVTHGRGGLSRACTVYAEWAKADFSWWAQAENTQLPSWNMFVVQGACSLWLNPGLVVGRSYSIIDWWREWLALQVGDGVTSLPLRASLAGMPPPSLDTLHSISRCFDGTETLSAMYGDGRYGAVAAVRLLALRHPKHPAAPELIRLTGRYLEILATLLALSSRPWTDPGYRADNGHMWYAGPTVAPVGERSEAAGLQNDRGPILQTLRGGPQTSNRSGWPAEVFAKLVAEFPSEARSYQRGDDLPFVIVSRLFGVRLWSEQHWVRWSEGLLVWKPRRQNNNTPAVFWAWMDDSAKRMTIGYPYPEGKHRGKGASGAQGHCELLGPQGGWTIAAAGIDGGLPAKLILPVSGDPLWSIVGDTNGFMEEKL